MQCLIEGANASLVPVFQPWSFRHEDGAKHLHEMKGTLLIPYGKLTAIEQLVLMEHVTVNMAIFNRKLLVH